MHKFYNGSLSLEVGAHLQCRDILLADVICLTEVELFLMTLLFFFNICGTLKKHKGTTTTLQAANCFLVENTV